MTQPTTDPRLQQALDYMRYQGAKSLPDLAALMERTATDWQRCLEGMTEEQADFKPAVPTGPAGEDEWCPREVVAHLITTNRSLNQDIAGMAGIEAPAPAEPVRAMGVVGKDEASRTIADLRERVALVFSENARLAGSLEEGEKLNQEFPHPGFGPLKLKEWIAFYRVHGMDHVQQIDTIKADPAYPKG